MAERSRGAIESEQYLKSKQKELQTDVQSKFSQDSSEIANRPLLLLNNTGSKMETAAID